MKKFDFLKRYSIFFILVLITFAGCKKKETPQQNQPKSNVQTTDSMTYKRPDTLRTALAKIPDIKGKWTGTFDKRATTLNITEQNGMDFKGSITINYRDVINQQVSGRLDTASKQVTMKDLLHSRYAGSYSAKLGGSDNKLSGTFTMNSGGQKLNFNLSKK